MKTSRNDLIGWGLVGAGLVALMLLVPGLASARGPAPMRVLLGWGAFIAIPAVILGGVMLAFAGRLGWEVRWRAVVFGEVLFLAILGLLHLSLAQPIDAGWAGVGGGIVGQGMTQPLADLLGTFGARLVLLVAVSGRDLGAVGIAAAAVDRPRTPGAGGIGKRRMGNRTPRRRDDAGDGTQCVGQRTPRRRAAGDLDCDRASTP